MQKSFLYIAILTLLQVPLYGSNQLKSYEMKTLVDKTESPFFPLRKRLYNWLLECVVLPEGVTREKMQQKIRTLIAQDNIAFETDEYLQVIIKSKDGAPVFDKEPKKIPCGPSGPNEQCVNGVLQALKILGSVERST